jgi:hypothetical protein
VRSGGGQSSVSVIDNQSCQPEVTNASMLVVVDDNIRLDLVRIKGLELTGFRSPCTIVGVYVCMNAMPAITCSHFHG